MISDAVTESYNKNYPVKVTRFRRDRHKVQSWMTDEILEKITAKDKLYVQTKKAKNGSTEKRELKNQLDLSNQDINRNIIEAKSNYYSEKISNYKNDMKKTWSTINEIINRKRTKTNYPPFFKQMARKLLIDRRWPQR